MKYKKSNTFLLCNRLKTVVFLFFYTWLLFDSAKLKAQKDTLTFTQEKKDTLECKYDQLYKLFLVDKSKDTKQLWKIDLVAVSQLRPNLFYERKIGDCFSSNTGFSFSLFHSNGVISYYDTIMNNETYLMNLGFSEGLRYYYNMNRRERLGKRTSGFSGNFFELEGQIQYATNIYQKIKISSTELLLSTIMLKYGLQRRIGNIGFIEPAIGIGNIYSAAKYLDLATGQITFDYRSNYLIRFDLRIGFALDSFKNLNSIRIK